MGDFADDALCRAEDDWFGANDDSLSMEERYERGYCDERGGEYYPGRFVFERSFFYKNQDTRIRPSKPHGEGRCPICKKKTILKEGKFGKFYGCVNFPECKGSRNI